MENKNAAKRQRLARALEDSYPRDMTHFIDWLLPDSAGFTESHRYAAQRRALDYANKHYNAVEDASND